VSGFPSITLNTGCSSRECSVPEIQSFTCKASYGAFSMKLQSQSIMNIFTNTTKQQLQTLLRTKFNGIKRVNVNIQPLSSSFSSASSSPTADLYLNSICSPSGNNVTITFDQAFFPQFDGDVPTIYLNRLNNNPDALSGLSLGSPETFLYDGLEHEIPVDLPLSTTELQRGYNRSDGVASYLSGSGTNRISFVYTIVSGDIVNSLDVISLNFDHGYIYSSNYNDVNKKENVTTDVPLFGIGPRYMTSGASSLSFNTAITVTSKIPSITAVTSPNVSGIYTAGDALFIDVEFDLDISILNPLDIILSLETGSFSRQITFYSLLFNKVIRFLYIVQPLDISPALEYLSETALSLGENGLIYRETSGRTTTAGRKNR
jgi:hypothetical protein